MTVKRKSATHRARMDERRERYHRTGTGFWAWVRAAGVNRRELRRVGPCDQVRATKNNDPAYRKADGERRWVSIA